MNKQIHILCKVRGHAFTGCVDVEPVEAYTQRRYANAAANKKNEKATVCNYVVKTLKIVE